MIDTFLIFGAVLLRILSNPVGNVFQKQLTATGHHPLLVNCITYLLLSFVCVIFAINQAWLRLPVQFWNYSILGGIIGALGNAFLIKALQKGDLSVLGPVNAYKSVVGIVAGVIFLHEIPNGWGLLGVFLIIYGSYFVLDTTAGGFSWALLNKNGIQLRLAAMILTGIEAVFVKKVVLASSPLVAFISWCFFGAIFSALLLFIYKLDIRREIRNIDRGSVGKYIALIGCVAVMQLTTNYAFSHMPVGYALALFQLSAIVSVLLGYRIFKEQDIRKKLAGSVIMIAGSILIILIKK